MRKGAFALRFGNELQAWHRCPPRQSQWLPPLQPQHRALLQGRYVRVHSAADEIVAAADRRPGIQYRRVFRVVSTDHNRPPVVVIPPVQPWGRLRGHPRERVAMPDQTGPSATGISIATQYNDYIFILCMRITHERSAALTLSKRFCPVVIDRWH
jgi:hypothetical protein